MAKEIRCRAFFPDGKGGYRPAEELTPEEKEAWAESAARRMGEALNAWFQGHPEEFRRAMARIEAEQKA